MFRGQDWFLGCAGFAGSVPELTWTSKVIDLSSKCHWQSRHWVLVHWSCVKVVYHHPNFISMWVMFLLCFHLVPCVFRGVIAPEKSLWTKRGQDHASNSVIRCPFTLHCRRVREWRTFRTKWRTVRTSLDRERNVAGNLRLGSRFRPSSSPAHRKIVSATWSRESSYLLIKTPHIFSRIITSESAGAMFRL